MPTSFGYFEHSRPRVDRATFTVATPSARSAAASVQSPWAGYCGGSGSGASVSPEKVRHWGGGKRRRCWRCGPGGKGQAEGSTHRRRRGGSDDGEGAAAASLAGVSVVVVVVVWVGETEVVVAEVVVVGPGRVVVVAAPGAADGVRGARSTNMPDELSVTSSTVVPGSTRPRSRSLPRREVTLLPVVQSAGPGR